MFKKLNQRMFGQKHFPTQNQLPSIKLLSTIVEGTTWKAIRQQACEEVAHLISNQVTINHDIKEMAFYTHFIETFKSLIIQIVGKMQINSVPYIVGKRIKWYNHVGKQLALFCKNKHSQIMTHQSVPFLYKNSSDTHVQQETFIKMFIAALFIIANRKENNLYKI